MTLQLHKNLPTTAPTPVRGTSLNPQSSACWHATRLGFVLIGIIGFCTIAALPSVAVSQDQATYMPPVHVAPPQATELSQQSNKTNDSSDVQQVSYDQNVQYDRNQARALQQRGVNQSLYDTVPVYSSEQLDAARAMDVAQAAAQMRMQNQAVLAAKEAQIYAAQNGSYVYPYPAMGQQRANHQMGMMPPANKPLYPGHYPPQVAAQYQTQQFQAQQYQAQQYQAQQYQAAQPTQTRNPSAVSVLAQPAQRTAQPSQAQTVQTRQVQVQQPRPTQRPAMVNGEVDSSYGLQGKIAKIFKGNRRPTAASRPQSQPVQRQAEVPQAETLLTESRLPDRELALQKRRRELQDSRTAAMDAAYRRRGRSQIEKIEQENPSIGRAVAMDVEEVDNIPRDAFIQSGIKETDRPIQLTSQEEDELYGEREYPRLAQDFGSTRPKPRRNRPRISNSPKPQSYTNDLTDGILNDLEQNRRVPAKAVSVFGEWQEEQGTDVETAPVDSTEPSPFNALSESQDELPERTLYTPQDENLRDKAQKARDALDAEVDEIEEQSKSDLDEDLLDSEDEDSELDSRPTERSCEEFRNLLLDSKSIRDIALDISPPASSRKYQQAGISRNWTNRNGDVIGTGTMVDLRRGYVILDSGQRLSYARLSEADLAAVSDYWLLPTICGIGNRGSTYRNWTPQTVTWKASGLCHKPLFFENIQLERYGHSRGPVLQPIHSTVHFFKSLVTVPYQTSITPANECQYALGFYRPGNCAPWLLDPISITEKGLKRQALFITGAAFIP